MFLILTKCHEYFVMVISDQNYSHDKFLQSRKDEEGCKYFQVNTK
jgi:hypothetical protein